MKYTAKLGSENDPGFEMVLQAFDGFAPKPIFVQFDHEHIEGTVTAAVFKDDELSLEVELPDAYLDMGFGVSVGYRSGATTEPISYGLVLANDELEIFPLEKVC